MGNEMTLKRIMRSKRITAQKLAELTGIKHATLEKKLIGKSEFKFSEIVKICFALGIENPIGVFEER